MRNIISREDLIAHGRAKAQHAARSLVLQALSQEDGAFCRAMCTFKQTVCSQVLKASKTDKEENPAATA